MALFEVTYSLGSRGESGNAGFSGSTMLAYQKMQVKADGPNTAQRIVENMFGGTGRCLVNSVNRISD